MSLKWVFALIFFLYSLQTFAADIPFNQIIEETQQSQSQLSSEIRSQLVETQRKTPEAITVSQTVSLEGSKLTVYSLTNQH
jgi:hypothetical protein